MYTHTTRTNKSGFIRSFVIWVKVYIANEIYRQLNTKKGKEKGGGEEEEEGGVWENAANTTQKK